MCQHTAEECLLSNDDERLEGYGSTSSGHAPRKLPRRQIGVVSAVFIIFNRIIGTGIFATSSTILRFSGSIGMSLVMWLIGALIAASGMQVYIIWGIALPFNGGDKNYLEYLFPTPRRLATSVYAANAVLLAYAAGNSLVFAEYTSSLLGSSAPNSSSWIPPVRLLAGFCLTFAFLLHGLHIPAGLRLQNILGILKIAILIVVIGTGYIAFNGHLQPGVERAGNFESWDKIWEGTTASGSVFCTCLYNVIWCYIGFSNANYVLSEMHNPRRTLRIAGPVALTIVTVAYVLCTLSYYAAASKEDIIGSGRLVAALMFRNVWGEKAERALSGFIALSALGNVLSTSFSQGRVNQELGKEGILPFSDFWKSDWPARAPLAGLGLHWAVCNIVIFTLPEGDAFDFVLNVLSYSHAIINATISLGLIYLAFLDVPPSQSDSQSQSSMRPTFSPTVSLLLPSVVFASASIFLFVMPLVPPSAGAIPYKYLPYWVHAVGGWGVCFLGVVWWWFYGKLENSSRYTPWEI